MTNILPAYSDSLGPPSWISSPSLNTAAVTMATISAALLAPTWEETQASENMEGFLLGTVMASISNLNSHSQLAPLTSGNRPTVLTWNRLEAACLACDEYKLLHRTVQKGVSDRREEWDHQISDYYQHRHSLVRCPSSACCHLWRSAWSSTVPGR